MIRTNEQKEASLFSEARVPTSRSSIYLKQLCKHFGHRVPAEFTDEAGRLTFPFGSCELRAGPAELVLRAEAEGEEDLARLEDVVGRHLERFGHRETLKVSWSASA